jgi:hypothetical protein
LLARYDLAALGRSMGPSDFAGRSADLWRYRELLPVVDPARVVTLGEGWTPMLQAARYGAHVGAPGLLVKDEGLIPTGSFKARGAAVGVSRAAELGVSHVAMPTNGNAGAAWATYAARAGMRSTIAMPLAAPTITRRECLAAGADLHLVDGLIGDAGVLIRDLIAGSGATIFDASTLKEPSSVEGHQVAGRLERGHRGVEHAGQVVGVEVVAHLGQYDEVERSSRPVRQPPIVNGHVVVPGEPVPRHGHRLRGDVRGEETFTPLREQFGQYAQGAARLEGAAVMRSAEGGNGLCVLRRSYHRDSNSHGSSLREYMSSKYAAGRLTRRPPRTGG